MPLSFTNREDEKEREYVYERAGVVENWFSQENVKREGCVYVCVGEILCTCTLILRKVDEIGISILLKTSFNFYANSPRIFQQFGFMKNYCTDEKIAAWNTWKLTTESRWVEFFKHMSQHQAPYEDVSRVIEFILCFAGTSAPVERVFAKAKKIWTLEKPSLLPSTLKSILIVKNNMDYYYCEFSKFLEEQPDILRKISAQKKYDLKRPKAISDSSPSAMSID